MQGFFSLKTAADLREKLKRDLDKFKANPSSSDAAFNFFVTAEHVVDWAHPADKDAAKRTKIRESSELLRLCSHLANGAKHFEATHKRHDTAESTSAVGGGYFTQYMTGYATSFFPGSTGGSVWLSVGLQGDAAKLYGSRIGAVELAEKVMEYWAGQDLTPPPA